MLALQRDRWILWLPAALIAGAACWLLAPREPATWLGPASFAGGAGGAAWLMLWPGSGVGARSYLVRRIGAALCGVIAGVGLGMCAAQLKTALVNQPAYIGAPEPVVVEGWVAANDTSDSGPRLRLLVRSIDGIAQVPRYVRVSVAEAGLLSAGRAARCRAVLGPPAGPLAPGGYDFARRTYFERLGATGFAMGRCRPADLPPPAGWLDRQRLRLTAMRADLSAEIQQAAPGRGGAIAAALVTGDRSSVDAETNGALRDSGLGHLLSVSGIHMGVVGGLVFGLLLWTLSLVAPIALRWPVKKLAALGALLVLACYLVVSGSSVPALRSFIMACVAFGAILLDRPAISMRGLALAALLVTLAFPESVLEPGFQMSFAATMALVALFETMRRAPHEPALPTPGPLIGALQWSARGIGSVLLISLVAGIATDPFAIYHFQRFSIYGLPANLIAAPIMSFLVAPFAALAALLAPFGHAEPALQVMAGALDLIAAIGASFGERPEAVRALPRPPDAAFLLCVAALMWACLWRGMLRWGGAAMLAAAIALYAVAPLPVLAFDADLRAVYARAENGDWMLVSGRGRSRYARERLGAMLGLPPARIERLAAPESCSDALCTWSVGSRTFAYVRSEAGFDARACAADFVLSAVEAPTDRAARCRPAILIDAPDVARRGGGFVYAEPVGLRVARAWPTGVARSWTPRRGGVQE